MAIKIKSMNGLAALKKAGVAQELHDWLVGSDVEVKLTASVFQFSHAGAGVQVGVTLDQLQALNAGTMSPADKAVLAQKLESAIKKLQGGEGMTLPGGDAIMAVIGDALKEQKGALDTLPPLQGTPISTEMKDALAKAKAEGIKAGPTVV